MTLSPAATLPVTVDWATSDGTATAGADYTAASGSLTFNTGDESKTITVTVTGDDVDEPDETLTVTLTNESGRDARGTPRGPGRSPTTTRRRCRSATRAWPRALRAKSATLTFTVTLSRRRTLPVTVDWATSDGTATAGAELHGGEREPDVQHRR